MRSGFGALNRVEDFERARQSEIGLGADEQIPSGQCSWVGHQDRASRRRSCLLRVLRVVEEAQVFFLRGVERPDAADLVTPVANQVGSKVGGEVSESNARFHCAVLNLVIT